MSTGRDRLQHWGRGEKINEVEMGEKGNSRRNGGEDKTKKEQGLNKEEGKDSEGEMTNGKKKVMRE